MRTVLIPAHLKKAIARAIVVAGHPKYNASEEGFYFVGDADGDGIADCVGKKQDVRGEIIEVSCLLDDPYLRYADAFALPAKFMEDYPELYARFCRWAKRKQADRGDWAFWTWLKNHRLKEVRKLVYAYEWEDFAQDVRYVQEHIVDSFEIVD